MDSFRYFCTLFDSNYLSRGLLMIESLQKNFNNAVIYVFAFDDLAFDVLNKLSLKNVIPVSLYEFEDSELLRVKPSRSRGEYCWTCTPSVLLYCINKFNLPTCTYIDSDIYFYSSPDPIFKEMGKSSVLITPHWYTPRYNQIRTSGIYCVQFVTIKNDENGLSVLNWWRERCLEWCYARVEEGKFGDQKYLDHWPTQFKDVHILQHRGGGIAPWNVQQYKSKDGLRWSFQSSSFPIIFYHFHAIKIFNDNIADLSTYFLSKRVIDMIYRPYVRSLLEKDAFLKQQFNVQPLRSNKPSGNLLKTLIRILKREPENRIK